MQGYNEDYLEVVETPVNKQDKYFYQIIQRLDKIIELLSEDEEIVNDCSCVKRNCYDSMTIKELRDAAKDKGMSGYSALKKDELIKTLKECGD